MHNFKKTLSLISILAFIFCSTNLINAQIIKSNRKNTLVQSEKSDNSVNYQSVATFKTIARKKKYRLGEFISIDVALLNNSASPTYFLKLDNFTEVLVYDESGNKVKSNRYIYPLYSPEYVLLKKDEYASHHYIFLIGCEREDYISYENMKERFDKNDFTFKGRGCIDIKKSGKYFITAKISNSYTEDNKTEKTAVGIMKSTSFEIIVVNDSK